MKIQRIAIGLLATVAVAFAGPLGVAQEGGGAPVASGNGDVNGSGDIDIADASYLLNWLFLGGPQPVVILDGCPSERGPLENGDVNGSAEIDIADASYLLNWLFLGGPQPVVIPEDCGPTAIVGFTLRGTNAEGYEEYVHDQTGIVFVKLPGGTFEMGSPEDEPNRGEEEGPVHTVTLSPFLIAKYEVTQSEYEAVMGVNPSRFDGSTNIAGEPFVPPLDRGTLPVEEVSWNDLNAPGGFLSRTGLGLPSEAQWEYAARGGTQTAFSFGDACNASSCDPCAPAEDFMWWCANSGGTTRPVGTKLPNPFGLHDMHGNVWEWCEDWWASDFYARPEATELDPVNRVASGIRVFRGGSWRDDARHCRSAVRFSNGPPPDFALGFRPARPLP